MQKLSKKLLGDRSGRCKGRKQLAGTEGRGQCPEEGSFPGGGYVSVCHSQTFAQHRALRRTHFMGTPIKGEESTPSKGSFDGWKTPCSKQWRKGSLRRDAKHGAFSTNPYSMLRTTTISNVKDMSVKSKMSTVIECKNFHQGTKN